MFSQNFIFLTTSSYLLILSLHNLFQTCSANCTPSACGLITNISSPFRLNDDPYNCGDRKHELGCENNVTSFSLNSHKYYVKAINYDNSTIRVVDASIDNDDICSFPVVSAYLYNFTNDSPTIYPYRTLIYTTDDYSAQPLHLMTCPHPLKNSSLFTDISECGASSNSSHHRYAYIKVGSMAASELPHTCIVDLLVMTSWEFKDFNNVSLSEIHQSLLYGFELYFWRGKRPTIWGNFVQFVHLIFPILLVIIGLLCAVVCPPVFTFCGFAALLIFCYNGYGLYFRIKYGSGSNKFASLTALMFGIIIGAPRITLFPLALWLLIYKFRTRRLSVFDAIESFLCSDNNLLPIRYSYSDIRKMTKGFQDKLGQGGFGSVYKGKLRSGYDVAVKLLGKSGGNGQDFINEIATIGRVHHVNVVKLVGYCAQGSKRALIYDFMPNSSLEKYLFNGEKMSSLNWDTKLEIAVGVARGIAYLHRGCDVQILHFDIKPHNILLDANFTPKISDFGMAKFYSIDKNAVTMTAARGTIGYVAPELISRSIGAVSYKADVYSFGMLLVEMVGLKRDLLGNDGDSTKYFPCWIYDCFKQGKDIEIGHADENDNTWKVIGRKMIIVALWCIQMSPDDRPSMSKVMEMLEGDVERLRIPDYPSQLAHIVVDVDETGTTCSTDSQLCLGLSVEELLH